MNMKCNFRNPKILLFREEAGEEEVGPEGEAVVVM